VTCSLYILVLTEADPTDLNPKKEPMSNYADEISLVRFDFLTSVTINNIIFLDNVLCSVLDVYRCFGGKNYLHHHGRGIS
jgi:hypothetical protein